MPVAVICFNCIRPSYISSGPEPISFFHTVWESGGVSNWIQQGMNRVEKDGQASDEERLLEKLVEVIHLAAKEY